LPNSKYCAKQSHKRCELEDREREETKKRKRIEKAYERDTGRKIDLTDSDDDDFPDPAPKRIRTAPEITSMPPTPRSSATSTTATQPTNVLSQRPRPQPSNEVQQLREQLAQMQQMMTQFLQAQKPSVPQQPPQQPPQQLTRPSYTFTGDPDLDALLGDAPASPATEAALLLEKAKLDNTDRDGDVDIGTEEPPKQTGENEKEKRGST
jgi:hypothetical protein